MFTFQKLSRNNDNRNKLEIAEFRVRKHFNSEAIQYEYDDQQLIRPSVHSWKETKTFQSRYNFFKAFDVSPDDLR